MDPYIGQIFLVGFNFAPPGFVMCDGSLLPIQQYAPLFSLLGTAYGGNGTTNFAVPDLRSRAAVGFSTGAVPGLTPFTLGTIAGSESVTLSVNQLPAHNHTTVVTLPATANAGTSQSPANLVPAVTSESTLGASVNAYGASDNVTKMAPSSPFPSTPAGGSQPVGIRNPFLAMNYIIATQGIFPSRQ
jgi:microcystin-dependent protein